jgi:hypothetical protein
MIHDGLASCVGVSAQSSMSLSAASMSGAVAIRLALSSVGLLTFLFVAQPW